MHTIPIAGEVGIFQCRSNLGNQVWLHQPDLRQRLNTLPGRDGFFVCDMGKKLVNQTVIAVFAVPAGVGSKNGDSPVPYQRIFMVQQRDEVIEIRIKPVALPAFRRKFIRIGAGGLGVLVGQTLKQFLLMGHIFGLLKGGLF